MNQHVAEFKKMEEDLKGYNRQEQIEKATKKRQKQQVPNSMEKVTKNFTN